MIWKKSGTRLPIGHCGDWDTSPECPRFFVCGGSDASSIFQTVTDGGVVRVPRYPAKIRGTRLLENRA